MREGSGIFTRIGVIAIAILFFIILSTLLAMIIVIPIKLLRGYSFRQAIAPEPEAIFFGITALCIIMIFVGLNEPYPNEDRINILAAMAFLSGIKSIHSLIVICCNPITDRVEVETIIRH